MSIFKETFPDFVQKQLEQRENTISSGTGKNSNNFSFNEDRSNNFFTYQQKQCILRLSSGVDIVDSSILDENLSGEEIAKRWVLEGGIKDGNTNRGGIGPGGAYGDSTLRSNTDDGYGIVPMPGIIDANIRTKSAYGSLREAKVNFVCHNRRQLEVMELLYMRPGYTLLLEWQWSPFIDNDGNADYTTVKKIDFFNKSKNMSSMERDIESYKQETGGNYDALIGYCKNFTYRLRADGGFDCETEIIAKGEVLESLKDRETTIKFKNDNTDTITSRPNLEIFLTDLVAFNNATSGVGEITNQGESNTVEGGISKENAIDIQTSLAAELAPKIGLEDTISTTNLSPFILTGGPQSYTDWGQGLTERTNALQDDDKRGDWGDWEGFWSIVGLGRRFRTNTTWVRWDALCYYINNSVIPLNEHDEPITSLTTSYLSHPNEDGKVYLEPLLYSSKFRATKYLTDKIQKLQTFRVSTTGTVNPKEEEDRIYWITDISVNNQICMLPHNLYQYKDAPDYGNSFEDFNGIKLKDGIMKTSFHKPLVKELINKNSFNFVDKKNIDQKWSDSSKFSINNIGGIYFGAEYLLKIFRGMYYTDEGNINKDYTLFNFIKKMWDEVNSCTQNGHDFDLQTDNRGGCNITRIIDRQMDNSSENIENAYTLKIQSLDSIVRNITYNTTIPSSLSSTIAIAAQSPDSIDDLDKVSFAALNKGIKDRFAILTTTNNSPSEDQIKKWENKFEQELIKVHGALNISGTIQGNSGTLINLLYREYQSNRNYILKEDMAGVSPKNSSSNKGALKNIMSALNFFQSHHGSTDEKEGYYRGQPATDGTQPLSAVIPLKFNAQLDGISGIVIGNVFKLPKDKLPIAYGGSDIHFIVMGEEQSITSGQDWTTTISGHLILLGNASSTEYQNSKHFKSWKEPNLNISQDRYIGIKTQGDLSESNPNVMVGSKRAGTIVGSTLGDPLESIKVNSVFGKVREGSRHFGTDFKADSGAIAYAVADGTVEVASNVDPNGWGGTIKIRFDNDPLKGGNITETWGKTSPKYALYAHMKKWWKGNLPNGGELQVGDRVKKGESIGLTGGGKNDPYKGNSNGAHLHLEFYLADNKTKIDPVPWIPGNVDGGLYDASADKSDGALGTNLGEKTDGGLVQTSRADALSGERLVIEGRVYHKGEPDMPPNPEYPGKFYVKDGYYGSYNTPLYVEIDKDGLVLNKSSKIYMGTEFGAMQYEEFAHYYTKNKPFFVEISEYRGIYRE